MLDDIVYSLTNGRPFIFVIMKYNAIDDIYDAIKGAIDEEFGLACIRADDVKSAGYDLLAKIQKLIERAEVIIADISLDSPNVYYEIGYAVGKEKRPIIIVDKNKNEGIPVDLQGLEVIKYEYGHWGGVKPFIQELQNHLRFRLQSSNALLRDMLIPPIAQNMYIVASPKYTSAGSEFAGQAPDIRTFGDYLGVMGLLTAFGSTIGEVKEVQFVSGQYYSNDLHSHPLNLFLIGSRKSNPLVGKMMEQILRGKEPYWSFDPPEGDVETEDWHVRLYREENGQKTHRSVMIRTFNGKKIWDEDYGLILRAPHPQHPDRQVLIMAGAHSLGTGAACIAATSSPLIKEIQKRLPDKTLADKSRIFWVLVKGKASEMDGLLDYNGVEVCDAGVYN